MNTNDFHALKIEQAKDLNKIVQIARKNDFKGEDEEVIVLQGRNAISMINTQIEEMLKQTEGIEFDPQYDFEAPENENIGIPEGIKGRELYIVQKEALELLHKALKNNEGITAQKLTKAFDNSKMTEHERFNSASTDLKEVLEDMVEVMSASMNIPAPKQKKAKKAKKEKVIKHTLNDEDVKNNPDLEKEGLKAGDKIEVSLTSENPDHTLTEQDLINHPNLEKLGFKVGDEVKLPEANKDNH